MNLIKWAAEGLAFLAGLAVAFYMFVLFISILVGLLFGFSYDSPVCTRYRAKTTTVGELLIAPTIPYSCGKDSGFLVKPLYKALKVLEIQPFK